MKRSSTKWRLYAVVLGFVLACGVAWAASPFFRLASGAFVEGGSIPVRFTCDGAGLAPPLSWAAPPAGTRSLALIVTDPDAPDPKAPRMTWVHWVLYDLPPTAGRLAEGAKAPPRGARGGLSSWNRTGYGGPCPPIGRHRYFFRLYALDTRPDFASPPDRAALLAAMRGHVLAEATLMGTYRRPGR